MPFWGVVMGVVNIIMGVARGRYHQLPEGVAMVPEGSLKKLEPMWVPSVKMGYETYYTQDQKRYTRLQLRKKRKIDASEDVADDEDLGTGVACRTDITVEMVNVACQTDFGIFDFVKIEEKLRQLKEDNQHLHTEASEAKQQVERASLLC